MPARKKKKVGNCSVTNESTVQSATLDTYVTRLPINVWPVGQITRGWIFFRYYMYQRNIEQDYAFHLGDGDALYADFKCDPYGLISSIRFGTDPLFALLLYEIVGENQIYIYQIELVTKRMPANAHSWLGLPPNLKK